MLLIRAPKEGHIREIFVTGGALVEAGQPLFQFNDVDERVELETAKASIRLMEQVIARTHIERDRLASPQSRTAQNVEAMELNLKAHQLLHETREKQAEVITTDWILVKQTWALLKEAECELEEARHQRDLALRDKEDQLDLLTAMLMYHHAVVVHLDARLKSLKVRAPVAGIVALHLEATTWCNAGDTVATIVDEGGAP